MHLKSLFLGGVLTLGLALPAVAQALIDGSNFDEVVNIARGYGSATLVATDGENPYISGKIDGVGYRVYFHNCTDNKNCQDIRFYVGFLDNKPSIEAINAWNRDKRFVKAYLDSDLDAVLEYDVNLEYGVARENLDGNFALWARLLDQYAVYVGFK